MRSPEEIHSLIECMEALGGHEKEIALLRLVLGDSKSEWQVKFEESIKNYMTLEAEDARLIESLRRDIAIQDAEIRRLKSEPDHK